MLIVSQQSIAQSSMCIKGVVLGSFFEYIYNKAGIIVCALSHGMTGAMLEEHGTCFKFIKPIDAWINKLENASKNKLQKGLYINRTAKRTWIFILFE